MKYIYPLITLLIGVLIGYLLGGDKVQKIVNNITKKEIIYDTIVQKKIITQNTNEIENNNNSSEDTVSNVLNENTEMIDSLLLNEVTEDSIQDVSDNEIKINRDKKISSITLNIIYLDKAIEKDTIIKEILDINDTKPKNMVLEFWESPINFRGYKLSKSKLVVYDLSPQFEYKIYKKEKNYYLSFQNINYKMIETNEFLPFQKVEKSSFLP